MAGCGVTACQIMSHSPQPTITESARLISLWIASSIRHKQVCCLCVKWQRTQALLLFAFVCLCAQLLDWFMVHLLLKQATYQTRQAESEAAAARSTQLVLLRAAVSNRHETKLPLSAQSSLPPYQHKGKRSIFRKLCACKLCWAAA